jgi:hypothetical protein
MADTAIPVDRWYGVHVGCELFPEPNNELIIDVTGVMAGVRPGWRTVTGMRTLPRGGRVEVTASVDADALPPQLRCYIQRRHIRVRR